MVECLPMRTNGAIQRGPAPGGDGPLLAAEDLLHFLRTGGSAQVPVIRFQGQKGIADTAAYGIGGKTGVFQPGNEIRNRTRQFHAGPSFQTSVVRRQHSAAA